MFVLLPFVSFIFLFLIFQKKYNCLRSSVLSAAIVWGLLLTAITEILSLFKLLILGWVLGLWVLASLVAFFILLILSKKEESNARPKVAKMPLFLIVLIVSVAFIVATVGLISLVAPPNNWDSHTYHMSRVVHWIQNRSVAFYPTHIPRQLYHNPWAEFAIMHFQILSHGDRFANLIQWFSMIGSILGVTLIAKQLGADPRVQILAAVVSATIPMGILQGSTTQTDYVVSFWLVCFVYYIRLSKTNPNWNNWIMMGGSLGLAVLTKGTAYIYAFPFLAYFVLSGRTTLRWKLWKPVFIISILVLSINLGHYARNLDLYGSPLGSNEIAYSNEVFTLPTFISNTVRNLSLHIGTPLEGVNGAMEGAIRLLHKFLNVNINDPRTTFPGTEFHVEKISNNVDLAGNAIHFLLIFLSIAICLTRRNLRRQRDSVYYLVAVIGTFLLFSFFLKWQPWHSRLHLPLFVLWAPFVAIMLSKIRNQKITNSIAAILILLALPYVFYSQARPLIGSRNIFSHSRTDQYFNDRVDLRDAYVGAVNFVNSQKCSDIGLSLSSNDWDYPFWVLLQNDDKRVIRIEHFNVKNISAIKSNPVNDFKPCAIISLNSEQGKEIITKKGYIYTPGWSSGQVNVFIGQEGNWSFVDTIRNKNGIEHEPSGRPFFWLGNGETEIELFSKNSGWAHFMAGAYPGPSLPENGKRRIRISSGQHVQELMIKGPQEAFTFAVPIQAGKNVIKVLTLDKPTILTQPASGDTRPLLVMFRNLRLARVTNE